MHPRKAKPKSLPNAMLADERAILLDNIENDEERMAVIGLFYTGMRVSEFVHMNKSWINWRTKCINVPEEMKCPCLACLPRNGTWQPKTKQGARVIPILAPLEISLKPY